MSNMNLASEWTLSSSKPGFAPVPARVPGDNYSALLDAGVIPDPYIAMNEDLVQWVRDFDWTWSRDFELDEAFLKQNVIFLNIDSVDTFGAIRINGRTVGHSENMFTRFRANVKEFLKAGTNRIEITIDSALRHAEEEYSKLPVDVPCTGVNSVKHLNLIRKVQCHGGWDWGITLLVSGLYGKIYLQGVQNARIEHVYSEQEHSAGLCKLTVHAELIADHEGTETVGFTFNGETKSVSAELKPGVNTVSVSFEVRNPKLWNPVGYGEQNLYELTVATADEKLEKKIGLRTLALINEDDEVGRSMKFRVNGVDIFCKGADWIPMDAMPQRFTRERYHKILSDTVEANMNMLRVWGGGQYENEDFYELCDELGILIWHDCMFACSHYPSFPHFLGLVREEIEYQVKRLRDHASIALWCGDNEVARAINWYPEERRKFLTINYDRLNRAIGETVEKCDPTRTFWPSSPCNGPMDYDESTLKGDMHYWLVWHSGKPFSAYYDVIPRFCSEFGYQSFPSMNSIDIYCAGRQRNVTSPLMEHHQRNSGGNSRIMEMFTRYFRFPTGFEDFIYLSQVQQALAIKTGVEFWRHLKPVCMGTLYWQLNDNWPVASWASIDYYGNWKQLHYAAKRFYSPVVVTCFQNKENNLEIWATSDVQKELKGTLKLSVLDFDGKAEKVLNFPVELKSLESVKVQEIDVSELAPATDKVFAFLELEVSGGGETYHHYNDHFFTEYKHCDLREAGIEHSIEQRDGVWHLKLSSKFPAFFVFAELRGVPAVFSDNSFTLLPGQPRELTFRTDSPVTREELERILSIRDLRGCYTE